METDATSLYAEQKAPLRSDTNIRDTVELHNLL